MSPHAFAPARRGRSRGRTYRWWCCFTPCGMSSMKVMVGGAESASVTRTSGVCPGSLSRALKVPLSSPSFWQCFLISRAWRTLQASWPDRSRHCARPRGCRPMIVEDTKPGTARPRRSLRVSHTRVAHASGSLRPTRAPRNLCMKSGCFDRPDRKIFSLRGPTMVGRAASRPERRGWPRTVFQIQHVFETLIGISGRRQALTGPRGRPQAYHRPLQPNCSDHYSSQ